LPRPGRRLTSWPASRATLDDRDLLRNGQGRTRSRSLRSALLARVASSHEPSDDSPCIPRQIASRSSTKPGDGRFTQQTKRKESERYRPRFLNRLPQLGVTICAIGHLLACAVFLRQTTHSFLFEWINWRIRHNEIARKLHYQTRRKMQL
jgi:hypothetical protein